ncbi:MAG: hypothetical protein NVSMB27_15900 [Ktedonobacteraceae bacterium]
MPFPVDAMSDVRTVSGVDDGIVKGRKKAHATKLDSNLATSYSTY